MAAADSNAIARLETTDTASGDLNVVVETPQGSRNKFKYDDERGLFKLSSVLPDGAVFPFDFGFIPGTRGQDGDPLDVLVLMDQPTFTGCLVACRLIGVIEAEQTVEGETERNDRLLAVAAESHDHRDLRRMNQLSQNLLHEIEHFFVSYASMQGKEFKLLGRYGPGRANKLLKQGQRAARLKEKRKRKEK